MVGGLVSLKYIGVISVEKPEFLDYEIRQKLHFIVLAENGLSSMLCGMTVLIQDLNDNAPRFEQSYFTASVWEGQLYSTDIMQVTSNMCLSYIFFQLGTVILYMDIFV